MVNSILLEELLELAAGEYCTIIGHNELWKPMCGKHCTKLGNDSWQMLLRILSQSQAIECTSTTTRKIFSKTDLHSLCGDVPPGVSWPLPQMD